MIAFIFWLCIFVVVYTYAGYPALLALLARTRKKALPAPFCEPSVTLLIAAYNEEAFIRQKLENALHLDYPAEKLQILVAADGSDDQTADIVRSFAAQGVQLSFQPARLGKMAAINRAMELARGEVVVFSDANNLYEPGTLRALVLPFGDPLVGGVSGAKHVIQAQDGLSKSEGLYWKYESFIKKQETRLGSCSGVSGEVFAIRRHLFEPAPAGIINDDFYMALRLLRRGCRIVYSSQARSFERVSLTAEDEIIRRTRINAGRYQAVALAGQLFPFNQPVLLWQIISHKLMRLLVPFAMIGALITNFIALFLNDPGAASAFWALKQPFSSLFFALQCLFYLMAWVGNLGKITGKAGKVLYLPAFLFNSNLAAWQGFMRFITGRQTALWQRARRAEEGDGQHGA